MSKQFHILTLKSHQNACELSIFHVLYFLFDKYHVPSLSLLDEYHVNLSFYFEVTLQLADISCVYGLYNLETAQVNF